MTTTRKKWRLPICSRGQAGLLVVGFLAFFFLGVGGVNAQSRVVFSDDFNRTDSPTIGSGWIDQAGNVGSIVSNKLQILNTAAQGFNQNRIARPVNEAHLDVEVSAEFSFGTTTRISGIETRIQDNDNTSPDAYYALFDNNSNIGLGRIINGTPSAISGTILSPSIDTGHVYRITLNVTGTLPTTLMATVYDVTASQIVATLSGTDNTAILQNPGTVALFNNDVGKSVFVDNFLYTTTDEENTVVPISNTSIAISPYTWYSGSDYKQINAAGGYIKVAFSGTHLGVGVDTSKLAGISPSNIFLRTYIDGSTTPVNKTLANVNNGEVVFSDNLASGNHYAIIYGGFNVSNSRRSGNPPASLMIKSIILSTGSEVQSLTGTPIVPSNKKILFYGDSITEGSLVSVAEKGYAPTLAKNLGLEYGQLGYGGGRWNTIHSSGVPAFYTNTITDNRRNYSENKCRLDGNGKYLDGAPTAIFNNYGINDARGSTGAPTMRSAVTGWLGAARAASSPNTEMYMIMPFNYGNGSYDATYKAAYLSGFQDYTLAHPDDDRVYLIDLGVKAWDVVDTNSIDDLHPNDTGSALLAGLIKDALTPLVVQNLSGIVDSDTEISLIWEYPAPDTNNIRHINTDYNVAYQASGTSTWTTFATLPGVTTGIQITGLTAGTNYTFRITSLNTLVVPDVAPIATISALTTGTPPVTPPTNPTTPTIPTSSGGGGGGTSLKADSCPAGDLSPSYYDGTCGTTADLAPLVVAKVNVLRPLIRLIYITATEKEKTLVHDIITSCSVNNKKEVIKLACQELVANWDF